MSNEDNFAHPEAKKKPAIARFYKEAMPMQFLSEQAGRAIFGERELVEISIPGDMRSKVVEPVNDEHKARWPLQYEAFKRNEEQPREGTWLKNWPNSQMTTGRVAELAALNIVTVEELGAVADGPALQNLGMGGWELRETARKFIEVSRTGTGPIEQLVLGKKRAEDECALLRGQLDAANAQIVSLQNQVRATSHVERP